MRGVSIAFLSLFGWLERSGVTFSSNCFLEPEESALVKERQDAK